MLLLSLNSNLQRSGPHMMKTELGLAISETTVTDVSPILISLLGFMETSATARVSRRYMFES